MDQTKRESPTEESAYSDDIFNQRKPPLLFKRVRCARTVSDTRLLILTGK